MSETKVRKNPQTGEWEEWDDNWNIKRWVIIDPSWSSDFPKYMEAAYQLATSESAARIKALMLIIEHHLDALKTLLAGVKGHTPNVSGLAIHQLIEETERKLDGEADTYVGHVQRLEEAVRELSVPVFINPKGFPPEVVKTVRSLAATAPVQEAGDVRG